MMIEVIIAFVMTGRVQRRRFGTREAAVQWAGRVEDVAARRCRNGLRSLRVELVRVG